MPAIRSSKYLPVLTVTLALCLTAVTGCYRSKAKLTAENATASFDAPNALLTRDPHHQ